MEKILIYPVFVLFIQSLWASGGPLPAQRDFIDLRFEEVALQIGLYEQALGAQTKCCLCNIKKYLTGDPKYVHTKERSYELCKFKCIFSSKKKNKEQKISLLLEHLEAMNQRQPFNKYGNTAHPSFGQNFYNNSKTALERCRAHLEQEKLSSSL